MVTDNGETGTQRRRAQRDWETVKKKPKGDPVHRLAGPDPNRPCVASGAWV